VNLTAASRRFLSLALCAALAAAAWAGATLNKATGTNGTIVSLAAFGFDPGTKMPKVALVPVAGGKSIPMKVVSASAIRIDAEVKKGLAGDYTLLITPPGRHVTPVPVDGTFTIVVPAPASLEPATGPVKLPVVIHGDSFGVAKGKVTVGGKIAKVTRWENDRIEIVVPKKLAAGAQSVVVLGKSGTSTAALPYTVVASTGGGSAEFMRVDVGSTHLEQIQRSAFYFSGSYNVSQNFAGIGVSKPPNAIPSIALTIDHPDFATPAPFDVGPVPTAAGTLGVTYSDGAGSVYQAAPASDMKLTITSYANGLLAGTFGGTLSKVAGPGSATLLATGGAFRVQLTITGQ
jgi:hypothetical protein